MRCLYRSTNILRLAANAARRSFSSSKKVAASIATDNHLDPKTHFVFGANTDIGKTVLTAALIRAAGTQRTDKMGTTTTTSNSNSNSNSNNTAVHYIKPLQTAGSDCDESFVRKHASHHLSSATTLFDWETPCSPHFAARIEDKPVSDEVVLEALGDSLATISNSGGDGSTSTSIWIETAGGVMSPSSSSPQNRAPHHARNSAGDSASARDNSSWGWVTQADLYKAFRDRSSVVLIGDGTLGGISNTLTALEALLHRNYNVGGILLIRGDNGGGANDEDEGNSDSNLDALREYAASYRSISPSNGSSNSSSSLFANPERSIISLPPLPPEPEPLNEWFASSDVQDPMSLFVHGHLFESYNMK
jgi:dethiobiotin synthetase/adenosylmethionine--8-amino-7-oxononanoate aminotransferase